MNRNNKRDQKKKNSVLEKEIFSIIKKSLKIALDRSLDELLKDFK